MNYEDYKKIDYKKSNDNKKENIIETIPKIIKISYYYMLFNIYSLIFLINSIFDNKSSYSDIIRYVYKYVFQSKIKIKTERRLDNNADVYLCNHSTCADFIIDPIITNGACGISRKLVFIAFLFPSLYALIHNKIKYISINTYSFGVVLRKCIQEKQKFFFYPEGGRNPYKKKMLLRKGGLQEVFNNNLSVQIIISYNKEKIFNEFTYEVNKEVVVYVYYSELIKSTDYNNFDDFFNKVNDVWYYYYRLENNNLIK